MRAAWLIAANDLRASVRSRAIFVLAFVAPLSLALILNVVFGDLTDPDASVSFDVGVAVLDDGPIAESFLAVVDELRSADLLEVTTFDDAAAARAAIDRGDVDAAWVVPADFSAQVQAGTATTIEVVGDVDSPTTATVAESIATGFAASLGTSRLAGLVAMETGVATPADIDAIARDVAEHPLAAVADSETASSALDPPTSMMAGMAVFFTLFTAGMPAISVLRERTDGTLARLLAAPIPSGAITAGKTLAGVITGVVAMLALMAASAVIMDADWGPPAGAALLAIAVVLAAAGIMSVAASFAKSAEQAGNAQAIVAVTIGFLGGTFVPLPTSGGGLVAMLSLATPNQWFIRGLRAISDGAATDALPATLVLLAMAAVTGAGGLALSRSALRR